MSRTLCRCAWLLCTLIICACSTYIANICAHVIVVVPRIATIAGNVLVGESTLLFCAVTASRAGAQTSFVTFAFIVLVLWVSCAMYTFATYWTRIFAYVVSNTFVCTHSFGTSKVLALATLFALACAGVMSSAFVCTNCFHTVGISTVVASRTQALANVMSSALDCTGFFHAIGI